MASDFGTPPVNYKPDVINYSGGIATLARQIIEGARIRSKFDIFTKGRLDDGKDVEVIIYEQAKAKAFNASRGYVAGDVPVSHALILKQLTELTYDARISRWEIRKASIDPTAREAAAQRIVDTLYQGRTRDKNASIMQIFTDATSGTAGAKGTEIVSSASSYAPVTDEASAKKLITAIKDLANRVLEGDTAVNPSGLLNMSEDVVIVIPYALKTALDVYANAANPNDEYLRYGGNVITYNPALYTGADEGIFIVDVRYIQHWIRDEYYSENRPTGTGGAVDASLDTSDIYGACPFFNAVKIAKAAAAGG